MWSSVEDLKILKRHEVKLSFSQKMKFNRYNSVEFQFHIFRIGKFELFSISIEKVKTWNLAVGLSFAFPGLRVFDLQTNFRLADDKFFAKKVSRRFWQKLEIARKRRGFRISKILGKF